MSVEVLMSTYNGEKYIAEQLNSIKSQTVPVHLTIRDDGSTDSTVNIIKGFSNISFIEGENVGSTESFLKLIDVAPESEYYAFADQDDVWDFDKLEYAITLLRRYESIPTIYSGNTRLVDSNLKFIRNENKKPKVSLGSAIVKNYATGCTVVFNKRLMDLLKKHHPVNVPFHDWWVNLVCLSVGGISIFDDAPHMSYRQHGSNVIGGYSSLWGKWSSRMKKFNRPYHRNEMVRQILNHYEIENEAKRILELIAKNKTTAILRESSISTGDVIDDKLFVISVLLKRI